MISRELLDHYLSCLKTEISGPPVLFDLIEEFQKKVVDDVTYEDWGSFLDSLNIFEDVLDAKVIYQKP